MMKIILHNINLWPLIIIKERKNIYKSELFTIGVILYFLFTGKYPFGNNSQKFF